jgi:hypothetical protein
MLDQAHVHATFLSPFNWQLPKPLRFQFPELKAWPTATVEGSESFNYGVH